MAQVGPASSIVLTLPNLPAGTTAVVLNLAATQLQGAPSAYESACPAAQALGSCVSTSVLNVRAGFDIANEINVPVGADGQVRLYNSEGSVDLIADLVGYLSAGYKAVGPMRVLDTRVGVGVPVGQVGPGAWVILSVPNMPVDPKAVVLNVTATQLQGAIATFESVCPLAQPLANCVSTPALNVAAGVTIANELIVPVGADGQVRLYNEAGSVDLAVDLTGYLSAGYVAVGPTRVLDTLTGIGAPQAQVGPDGSLILTLANLPVGTKAVVLNLTGTRLQGVTATTESACPAAQPLATCIAAPVLYVPAGATIANEITVPVAADGQVRLHNGAGSLDLSADLVGYYGG